MKVIRVNAHAKINLTLDIVGAEGGYHTLDSLVATIALHDRIVVRERRDGAVSVRMHGMGSERISMERNNAYLAAVRFFEAFGGGGADVAVYKRIPIGGGLGGSSADAAGVLNALALLRGVSDMGALKSIADGLGSDTGYLLTGGFARIRGRGEQVTPLTGLPTLHLLIACPKRGVSTPQCFRTYDELGAVSPPRTERLLAAVASSDMPRAASLMGNALFEAAAACNPDVASALAALQSLSPLGAGMTGSGSACFAVFADEAAAQSAARAFRGKLRLIRTRTVVPPVRAGERR